jgi:uncharacterized protein (TIGR00255 family)
MLYSMTGFGRSDKQTPTQRITVQIKSVNSKSFDYRSRLPFQYQQKELEIRRIVQDSLQRGKVDLSLTVESTEEHENSINKVAFAHYWKSLQELRGAHDITEGDPMSIIMRLPGVVQQNNAEVSDTAWLEIEATLQAALVNFNQFRAEEGTAMTTDINSNIRLIATLLEQVNPLEQPRVDKIKSRLLSSLEQLEIDTKVDENRLQQEILFYLDKFDLNEEKIRLAQHCNYFLEEIAKQGNVKGKKLGFIMQEIGREINTIGSKANDAEIQRIVIQMKNTADKIKEQLANIL